MGCVCVCVCVCVWGVNNNLGELSRRLGLLNPGAPIPAPGSLGRSLATQSCTPLTKKVEKWHLKTIVPCKGVASAVQLPLRTYTRKREGEREREGERGEGEREERGRGRDRESRARGLELES